MSLTLGSGLGLLYDFLRPLRPGHTILADGLFILSSLLSFLFLDFQICGGNLRFACILGSLLGGWILHISVGRLLQPFFYKIFRFFHRIIEFFLLPGKKILFFLKKLFAYMGK